MRQPDRFTGAKAPALPTLCAALALLVVAGGATAPATVQPPASPLYEAWQTAPNAPFAYTRFDAEYSLETGRVYFLGGRLANGNTDGSVWSFDPATGAYEDTLVDMPVPISNYDIARLVDSGGAEIFLLFGGRPAAGGVTATVQGYYPSTNTATVFGSDPYPFATAPGGVAVVDNLAYSFGGFDAVGMSDETWIFDITAPDGTRWTSGPSLALARSYIGAAVVDGVIYAIGGATFDSTALHAVQIVERLDPATTPLAWDDAGVANLPAIGPGPDFGCDEMRAFGLDSAGPYTVGNLIVVAGCGQWPGELAESLFYDVASDTWDVAGFPDLNQARRNHAGALIPEGDGTGGRPGFWVWGGRQGADTTVLTTPEWYPLLPLEIFSDGFESGGTGAWSSTQP